MKTAISIPDEVFERAERLAARLGTSRSQLYTTAVSEYVARHDSDAVSAAMDRVCEALDDGPDPYLQAAARKVLRETEW